MRLDNVDDGSSSDEDDADATGDTQMQNVREQISHSFRTHSYLNLSSMYIFGRRTISVSILGLVCQILIVQG